GGQVGERVGVERTLRACRGHRDCRSARRPTERRIEPRGRPNPHHARRATEGSEGTVERSETASLMRGRATDKMTATSAGRDEVAAATVPRSEPPVAKFQPTKRVRPD